MTTAYLEGRVCGKGKAVELGPIEGYGDRQMILKPWHPVGKTGFSGKRMCHKVKRDSGGKEGSDSVKKRRGGGFSNRKKSAIAQLVVRCYAVSMILTSVDICKRRRRKKGGETWEPRWQGVREVR